MTYNPVDTDPNSPYQASQTVESTTLTIAPNASNSSQSVVGMASHAGRSGSTSVRLLPVDIVPDDNMAGVVGDVVKSAKPGSTIKHFVSPKSDEVGPFQPGSEPHVMLKAGDLTEAQFNQSYEWEGGEPVTPNNKRKVLRTSTGTGPTEVKIKAKQGGTVAAQMDVWVAWVDVHPNPKPNAKPPGGDQGIVRPGGGNALAPFIEPVWKFEGVIEPKALITDAERPDLSGPPQNPTPEVGSKHVLDQHTFAKPPNKWDMTRQIRAKAESPQLGTTSFYNEPVIYGGLPNASKPITDYPSDELFGNDDQDEPPEYTNPYGSNTGKIVSGDTVRMIGPAHSDGNLGDTFRLKYHYREFARLEIGGKWFIISDKLLWRVHMHTVRKEKKDPFDPTKTIPGTGEHADDGHVTDDTNGGW